MNPNELPPALWWAFGAGETRMRRRAWLVRAREEEVPEVRRLMRRFAREEKEICERWLMRAMERHGDKADHP